MGDDQDSESILEEEIIKSINDDVITKEYEGEGEDQKPIMTRDQEKEYLLKIKEEFDIQYKEEIVKKEEKINELTKVVLNQDQVIKKFKNKLQQIEQEITSKPKAQSLDKKVKVDEDKQREKERQLEKAEKRKIKEALQAEALKQEERK